MLNNRDEKYESQEDSEYHFSDDEVSYELEAETPAKSAVIGEKKESAFSQFANRKRIIIGISVFCILVLIIYKFLMPASSVPTTDISPEMMQQNQMAKQTNPSMPTNGQMSGQMNTQTVAPAGSVIAQNAQPSAPSTPTETPRATVADNTFPAQPPQAIQQQNQAVAPPAVIPAEAVSTQSTIHQAALSALNAAQATGNSSLNVDNQRVLNQMQADYMAKINELAIQNKALQDQMSVLGARVAVMETQMNQIVQAVTRQNPPGVAMNAASNSHPIAAVPPAETAPEPKIFYSVQAIIPGRAWLRSDNGETVTVAEGDVIKEFGRVTKIDPYDGIVEINTGNKSVSLSYGNGG